MFTLDVWGKKTDTTCQFWKENMPFLSQVNLFRVGLEKSWIETKFFQNHHFFLWLHHFSSCWIFLCLLFIHLKTVLCHLFREYRGACSVTWQMHLQQARCPTLLKVFPDSNQRGRCVLMGWTLSEHRQGRWCQSCAGWSSGLSLERAMGARTRAPLAAFPLCDSHSFTTWLNPPFWSLRFPAPSSARRLEHEEYSLSIPGVPFSPVPPCLLLAN